MGLPRPSCPAEVRPETVNRLPRDSIQDQHVTAHHPRDGGVPVASWHARSPPLNTSMCGRTGVATVLAREAAARPTAGW